jgi:hypothetical protein
MSKTERLLDPNTKAWRIVTKGRRYVVLAQSADEARRVAEIQWPAVDFSRAMPVLNTHDNF